MRELLVLMLGDIIGFWRRDLLIGGGHLFGLECFIYYGVIDSLYKKQLNL